MDQQKIAFQYKEKLYHYTSFESACKIISLDQLKFSELNKMNDINESYRPSYCPINANNNTIENEISKYRQISLTMDGAYMGFNIPAMWGHYAERGNGVCLVFDKLKLLKSIDKESNSDPVIYTDEYNSDVIIIEDNISDFIKKHKEELFFRKTRDWSYEQEYRIIKRYDSKTETLKYLPLKNSLMAIVMLYAKGVEKRYSVFNSAEYRILNELIKDKPIVELGRILDETNLTYNNGDEFWSSKKKSHLTVDSGN